MNMPADKIGRPILAPGQGVLTAAKQTGAPGLFMNPTLRAKRIHTPLGHIERQAQTDIDALREENSFWSPGENLCPMKQLKHDSEDSKRMWLSRKDGPAGTG
ncbi:Acyl transferase/acyl hydrolase/lysophospholipase [Penicillium desertorum]|uniref:Acyl transferase/acyl hydrolase/lysophospholipase n=1 Tax=Penicillium desertorum TaxID=1303715 RepID=A0A9W9WHA5_9EURO|nr:Acyl transferase/acyl hydrolase/lysophospholipase [Penicillium desertorum]